MSKSASRVCKESTLGILSRLEQEVVDSVYVLRITDGQLERKEYVALNEALEALGGKWNRRAKGHVFAVDPADALDQLILTGRFDTKHAGDFFQTPNPIATELARFAVRPGDVVLEPSAGHGRLVRAALAHGAQGLRIVERDPARMKKLREEFSGAMPAYKVEFIEKDFLAVDSFQVDSVVMNPPFSRSWDVAHVMRAIHFLKPGGRLAAICSAGVRFREGKTYKELRNKIGEDAITDLPEHSFRDEGTDVNTVMIRWVKQ